MSLDVYMVLEKFIPTIIYSANITHNLCNMATKAGIYKALWRPEEIGITKAGQLIPILEVGIKWLKENKEEAEEYNAINGWGRYEHFVPFVEEYLDACRANIDANVRVSR